MENAESIRAFMTTYAKPFDATARRDVLSPFVDAYPGGLAAELREYLRLAGEHDLDGEWASGELRQPAVKSLRQMVEPASEPFVPETLLAFLAGTVKLLDCSGDFSIAAGVVGTPAGESAVYTVYGIRNTGVEARMPSLTRWCASRVADDVDDVLRRVSSREPLAALDPVRLGRRSAWLSRVFCEHDDLIWLEDLDADSRPSSFQAEAPNLAAWPHVAVYWLWALYFFDDAPALAEARRLAQAHAHPAVVETLALLDQLERGVDVSVRAVRPMDNAAFAAVRRELADFR